MTAKVVSADDYQFSYIFHCLSGGMKKQQMIFIQPHVVNVPILAGKAGWTEKETNRRGEKTLMTKTSLQVAELVSWWGWQTQKQNQVTGCRKTSQRRETRGSKSMKSVLMLHLKIHQTTTAYVLVTKLSANHYNFDHSCYHILKEYVNFFFLFVICLPPEFQTRK